LKFFGFEIKYRNKADNNMSVVLPQSSDGAVNIYSGTSAGFYGTVVDMGGSVRNENDLILRYREISQIPEVDIAIKDIVSDAISHDSKDDAIEIDLSNLSQYDETVKKKMIAAFNEVVDLFDMNHIGADIFERWYIDGRIYYQIIIDSDDTTNGVVELRYIDPLKIKKIRELKQTNVSGATSINTAAVADEYYLYNPDGITENTSQGLKLSEDSIAFASSGMVEPNTGIIIGNLQKAIRPVNQLKMLEDAMVIYRMTRATERRIFNVDVGDLPNQKAEQSVSEMMSKYRNKMSYDSATGQMMDSTRSISMVEDFWFAKRSDGRGGTTIDTLAGGVANQEIDDILYFKRKLYQSLNIPISRLEENNGFNLGKASEITRDELKFSKFINRLRNKFSKLIISAYKVHCIAKCIVSPDDWAVIEKEIVVKFGTDNYFNEFKTNEVLQQRISMATDISPYIGEYYSKTWVRKNIFKMTDEDIELMSDEIREESGNGTQDEKNQNQTEQEAQTPAGDVNPFESQEKEPVSATSDTDNGDSKNKSSRSDDIETVMDGI
jgi:hypothetical protein